MLNKIVSYFKNTQIIKQLESFKIMKYSILSDGSIDVFQNVDLSNLELTNIPFQFNKVIGSFNISHNQLTSLKCSPFSVTENFDCSHNLLITLKHSPQDVGKNFDCSFNLLSTLDGSPSVIFDDFICINIDNLSALKRRRFPL